MTVNVGKELAALRRMSVDGLRARYAEVFGETTNGRHKDWLIERIIYRLQVLAEGDLSERARRRAAELANDADLRRRPPKPATTKPVTPSRTKTAKLQASGPRHPGSAALPATCRAWPRPHQGTPTIGLIASSDAR